MNKKIEIWYPLRCMGIYKPFAYGCTDYLKPELIRHSEDECIELCNQLNEKEKENAKSYS